MGEQDGSTPASFLVLTELSLIQGILLPSEDAEIGAGVGNTEQGEPIVTEFLLDAHRIGLMNLTVLDPCCAGRADTGTAGTGDHHPGSFCSREDGLIGATLE